MFLIKLKQFAFFGWMNIPEPISNPEKVSCKVRKARSSSKPEEDQKVASLAKERQDMTEWKASGQVY